MLVFHRMFFEDAAICLCFCVPQAKKGLRITDGVAEIKRYNSDLQPTRQRVSPLADKL
jgi:hypothetical protein